MCLKLSCPVDCTTWLTRAGLISIRPARWKIHYRTAITYRTAQHKRRVSRAAQLELQPQRAHLMIVVSLIIKTHGSSKKWRSAVFGLVKKTASLTSLCTRPCTN